MKTISWLLIFSCWFVYGSEPASRSVVPVDYTVHPDVDITEKNNGPQRIVSVAPSISEMCAALGLADRVVGRTQFCTHPPTIQSAAIVGGYTDTNIEKIISLKPDIVLITDSSPKLADSLKNLNIRFETIPDNSLEDVYIAAEKMGRLLERPRTAQRLIDHLKNDLEKISRNAGRHHDVKVLFTFNELPAQATAIYVVGPGGYLDSLLKLAGYTNAAAGVVEKPWAQISVETILAIKPDYILETRAVTQPVERDQLYRGWSALDSIPAISRQQVRSLGNTSTSIPGPRINMVLYDIIQQLSK